MNEWDLLTETTRTVTFDIFDTLLHRRVRAPVDVFELVRLKAFETDFALTHHDFLDAYAGIRRQAEAEARKIRLDVAPEGEIGLNDIFDEMVRTHGIPADLLAFLREAELAFEDAVLFASPEGLSLYRAAMAQGVDVAILSDMYLPASWLRQKLEREGFEGVGALPIYVSGEHGVSKQSGGLYRKVAAECGWSMDECWLHVGDNRKADIERAEELGLRTCHADWANVSNRPQPAESEFGYNAIKAICGFSDLRQAARFLPEDPLERIGYRSFGPLLFGFTLWLLSQARKRRLKHLLFVARDGYLLQRLFERLKADAGGADITTSYFYMSRQVGYLSGMREWDEFQTAHIAHGRAPRSAARTFQTVGLDAKNYREELIDCGIADIQAPIPLTEKWRAVEALDQVHLDLLQQSLRTRQAVQIYYSGAFKGFDEIGFVDIGWVGNIQRLFINSLPDATARSRVHGLYLGKLRNSEFNEIRGIGIDCFMTQPPHEEDMISTLTTGGVELLEFALTADHGTTIELRTRGDGGIEPVLETPTQEERDYAAKALRIQAGIERFAEDHRYLLDSLTVDTLAVHGWTEPFLRLVVEPTQSEISELAGLTHSDAPGTNSERTPLVAPLTGRTRFSRAAMRTARSKSFWKAAFDTLYDPRKSRSR